MTASKIDLPKIMFLHKKWLRQEDGGKRANLESAYLQEANFQDADLDYVSFRDADLRRANFNGADLRRTTFWNANVEGCDFRGANFQGADLRCAIGAIFLGTPDGQTSVAYVSPNGRMRIRIGSQDKSLSEAQKYWWGKNRGREIIAALDYAETVAILRGWPFEAPLIAATGTGK